MRFDTTKLIKFLGQTDDKQQCFLSSVSPSCFSWRWINELGHSQVSQKPVLKLITKARDEDKNRLWSSSCRRGSWVTKLWNVAEPQELNSGMLINCCSDCKHSPCVCAPLINYRMLETETTVSIKIFGGNYFFH